MQIHLHTYSNAFDIVDLIATCNLHVMPCNFQLFSLHDGFYSIKKMQIHYAVSMFKQNNAQFLITEP